jgi:DNA-binding NtrC family response regulator
MHRCFVIVVEDEALLRILVEMTLLATDYDFEVLSDVDSALEALDSEAKDSDVLLTNVNLGDPELTGFDLARRARQLNPNIFVIYISGAERAQFEKEKVPGSVFLDKPVDTNRILEIVRDRCEPKPVA